MSRLKIGIVLESLGRPVREALDIAATLGVTGVQVDALGPLAPVQLTHTGRREFRHLLRARGLDLVALGCPLRHGFDQGEGLEGRVEHVRQTLSLAYDLGPRIVIAYGGPLDLSEKHPAFPFLRDSLAELGRHGDRVGATLALETGIEAPTAVAAFLAGFDTGGLGVNLDPASLLMHRHDPLSAVRAWQRRIVHVHARDARSGRADRGAVEVPLGAGDVDWIAFLGALEEAGYQGALTIKRGPISDPRGELLAAVRFLRQLLG